MALEPRPTPVITLTDPTHPGPLVDVLDSGPPPDPHRPTVVQLLAGVLVLLLVVAAGAVLDERADRARAERSRLAMLENVRFYSGFTGALHDPGLLEYLFVLVEPHRDALQVRAIRVTGEGWEAESGIPSPVFPRGGEVVALRHRLDCDATIRVRPEAVVTVAAGALHREVPLPLDPGFLNRARDYQRLACGELDAPSALEVIAAPARRAGDRLVLDLRLVNTSVYDVVVTGLLVEGLHLTSDRATPFVLPARAPGPTLQPSALWLGDLPGSRVRIVVRVRVCPDTGHVGAAAASTVLVQVDGRGGAAGRPVAVDGLADLASDLVRERCRGGSP